MAVSNQSELKRKTIGAEQAALMVKSDSWLEYVPVRLPGTITVRERLPAGAAAVLINRNHTYTDLYFPIDAPRLALWEAIDGKRTIAEILSDRDDRDAARGFFEQLYRWDQAVFALRSVTPAAQREIR